MVMSSRMPELTLQQLLEFVETQPHREFNINSPTT